MSITGGEWRVAGTMQSRYIDARQPDGMVQEVAWCGQCEYGDNVDNARLLCAAPDLLKELSFIVDSEEQSCFDQWLSRVTPSGDCDSVQAQWLDSSDFEGFCDLWSGPISAINKARGKA